MRARHGAFAASSVLACSALLRIHAACGTELEVAGQGVATVECDHKTRGGGVGPGLEIGVPVLRDSPAVGSTVLVRERTSALFGVGLAWGVELGAAWRSPPFGRWQPELGIGGMMLGGALIRSIDATGHESGNPIALTLGLSPIRFRLDSGWLNLLAIRAGWPLFRGGSPPFVGSLTLFEVGRAFEL